MMNGAGNGDRSVIELVDVYSDFDGAVEFLYKLLAERKVSESISHKRHPSFSEHYGFVLSQPYLGWYIIYDDSKPVGTCYITKYREVGIWLMPDTKGKGIGKAAMKQLLAMYPGRVFTNTSLHNDGAKAFYEKMGFRHCANMLECDNAGCSDHSGEAKQHTVATESAGSDRWNPGTRLVLEGR